MFFWKLGRESLECIFILENINICVVLVIVFIIMNVFVGIWFFSVGVYGIGVIVVFFIIGIFIDIYIIIRK